MQVGIRVTSASINLAYLNPIGNNWDNLSVSPNPVQVSNGPDYKVAKKAAKPQCGTMISMGEWAAANADLIAKKRELLNQQIRAAHARESELEMRKRAAKARERERNLRMRVLVELEFFNEDTWQSAAGSSERASSAINMDQKHAREMRNRTNVVRHGGILVQKTETCTNPTTGEETQDSYSERVGAISFYRYHDSHGQHGRKPRYKDVPRGDESQSSPHFRVKHARHDWSGDLITT